VKNRDLFFFENLEMKKIRITGVPEHFNYPIIELIDRQPLVENDVLLEWIPEPKGSGAMNQSLRNQTTDIAIILTESFLKDKSEGNPAKMIGYHINSPLIWGIHTHPKGLLNHIEDFKTNEKNLKFLISRFGSGSHLMSYLLAENQGFHLSPSAFHVINDLEGAKLSISTEPFGLFLWEKYTTQPLVNEKYFKRISEIKTPWPCFVIAAHENLINNEPELLVKIRDLIYESSSNSIKNKMKVPLISKKFNLSELDISAWIKTTEWAISPDIDKSEFNHTLNILKRLNLIKNDLKYQEFVHEPFIHWK
jgi:hypothetical protein